MIFRESIRGDGLLSEKNKGTFLSNGLFCFTFGICFYTVVLHDKSAVAEL